MKISLCGLGVLKKKEMTSFHTIVRWEGMEIRCNLRSKSKKTLHPTLVLVYALALSKIQKQLRGPDDSAGPNDNVM